MNSPGRPVVEPMPARPLVLGLVIWPAACRQRPLISTHASAMGLAKGHSDQPKQAGRSCGPKPLHAPVSQIGNKKTKRADAETWAASRPKGLLPEKPSGNRPNLRIGQQRRSRGSRRTGAQPRAEAILTSSETARWHIAACRRSFGITVRSVRQSVRENAQHVDQCSGRKALAACRDLTVVSCGTLPEPADSWNSRPSVKLSHVAHVPAPGESPTINTDTIGIPHASPAMAVVATSSHDAGEPAGPQWPEIPAWRSRNMHSACHWRSRPSQRVIRR